MGAQPITSLLREWGEGSETALQELTPLVYQELRKLAGIYLSRERTGHTLQPTDLVHELYLRLVGQKHQNWEGRAHFYGVAAHLMRLILVDWARKTHAGKRAAGVCRVPLSGVEELATEQRSKELIALDEALTALGATDPQKAKIMELRYFGGLTVAEVACSLSISTATVERESRFAQMWLCRELKQRA